MFASLVVVVIVVLVLVGSPSNDTIDSVCRVLDAISCAQSDACRVGRLVSLCACVRILYNHLFLFSDDGNRGFSAPSEAFERSSSSLIGSFADSVVVGGVAAAVVLLQAPVILRHGHWLRWNGSCSSFGA